MLKKDNPLRKFGYLLKYDLLSCGRILIPFYAALLIVAVIGHFSFISDLEFSNNDIFGILTFIAFFSLIVAICIVNFIFIVSRFKKNLLDSEGYLTLSLPVGIHNHLLSKLTLCVICEIACIIIVLLGVSIIFWSPNFFSDLNNVLKTLFIDNILVFLHTFIGSIKAILALFFIFTVGNLFTKHKFFLEVLVAIGLILLNSYIDSLFKFDSLETVNWLQIVFQLVWCGIYYTSTYLIFTKKLNLD